jgi:hypothetical protein
MIVLIPLFRCHHHQQLHHHHHLEPQKNAAMIRN